MSNKHTHEAKRKKDDEFYTRLADVADEMELIAPFLRGRRVLLPCDDFEKSNFARYLSENYTRLGLQRLVASCHYETNLFTKSAGGFWGEYTSGRWSAKRYHNGDFRSSSVLALARQADLIITNPPFSLFRAFYKFLKQSGADFHVISALYAVHYVEIFPDIKDCKVQATYKSGMAFQRASGEERKVRTCWFSSLKIPSRVPPFLNLTAKYEPQKYRRYENYPAINVDRLVDIPADYDGTMGVPVTFLEKWNPAQFEIVGMPHGEMGKALGVQRSPITRNRHNVYFKDGDKFILPYQRIFIRKKVESK